MKVLILGIEGMLGHRVYATLHNRVETFATFRGGYNLSNSHQAFAGLDPSHLYGGVDALDLNGVVKVVEEVRPDAVLNCIGIIKQRGEAKIAIPSIQVNALFPHQLAEICRGVDARLIHLSTDCVFSGNRGRYSEQDLPDPVDLYGRTKLLGELSQHRCLTLRTSIIGWELKHWAGLLEWFATQRGRVIKGYRGAIYSGLSTSVLARLIGDLLENHPDLSGIYQVASQPITKYELLVQLREALGWYDITIEPDDLFQCDRSLVGEHFESITSWSSPAWTEMIVELANEWPKYERWRELS